MAGFSAEDGVRGPNFASGLHLEVGFGDCRGVAWVARGKGLDVEVRKVTGGEIRVVGEFLVKPSSQGQTVFKNGFKALAA